MWTDAYVGLNFLPDGRTREGLDCWGIVQLVYREQKGIELPAYSGIYTMDTAEKLREVAEVMERESVKWSQVEKPQDFDIVRLKISGRLAFHVGLVVGKNFLHITKDIQSSVESLNSPVWKQRITGYYRYAGTL